MVGVIVGIALGILISIPEIKKIIDRIDKND